MKSGIYRIINKNNDKCYVGSTINFENRWSRHLKDLENQNHSSIKLQRSYNKHGKNSFYFEIIEEIPYEKEIIIERENFYIKKFNSKINGYNIADASFGNVLESHPNRDAIIDKISKGLIKTISKLTDEERKLKFGRPGSSNPNWRPWTHVFCKCGKRITGCNKTCSKCRPRCGKHNSFYGKTHSRETKEKISKGRVGVKPANAKILKIGDEIYNDMKIVMEKYGICRSSITYRVKSKKYDWSYINA